MRNPWTRDRSPNTSPVFCRRLFVHPSLPPLPAQGTPSRSCRPTSRTSVPPETVTDRPTWTWSVIVSKPLLRPSCVGPSSGVGNDSGSCGSCTRSPYPRPTRHSSPVQGVTLAPTVPVSCPTVPDPTRRSSGARDDPGSCTLSHYPRPHPTTFLRHSGRPWLLLFLSLVSLPPTPPSPPPTGSQDPPPT